MLYRINNYKLPDYSNQKYIEKNLNNKYILPGIYCNSYKSYWLYPIYYKYNLLHYLNNRDINYVNKTSQLECIDNSCKNSKDLVKNLYFFPIHSLTSFKDVKYIVNKLNSANIHNYTDNYFHLT